MWSPIPASCWRRSFNSTPFAGVTSIQRNSLVRAGGLYSFQEFGALQIWAEQGPIAGQVLVKDLQIDAPTYSGLALAGSNAISALSVDGVSITAAGTHGIQVGSAVAGQATFSNVQVSGAAQAGLQNDAPDWHFKLLRGDGNAGW